MRQYLEQFEVEGQYILRNRRNDAMLGVGVAGRRHPQGPAYPVTAEWRERVLARMDELGIRQSDLARSIGVADASLNAMFKPGSKQSKMVPAIHRALGWKPPSSPEAVIDDGDPVNVELMRLVEGMGVEDRQMLLDVARRLRRKAP